MIKLPETIVGKTSPKRCDNCLLHKKILKKCSICKKEICPACCEEIDEKYICYQCEDKGIKLESKPKKNKKAAKKAASY